MRRFRLGQALLALCLGTGCVPACGPTGTPGPSSTVESSRAESPIDPAKIARARGELPAGYEVADLTGPASPAASWGFKPGWTAEPPRCGALAGPPTDDSTTRGWSGSGPGGIVYATVTGSPAAPVAFDGGLLADCRQWTVTSGNTTGTVELVDAPAIAGATTVGMTAASTTVVEGGTETTSVARTFSAYAGDYLVYVTVVSDPGSPNTALGGEFAADLLVKTVSALRS